MEQFNYISTLISTLGFPIAMCVFFAWYITKRDEKEKEQAEKHKEEIANLCNVIQNNTITMQKLVDKIDLLYDSKKGE